MVSRNEKRIQAIRKMEKKKSGASLSGYSQKVK